MRVLFSTAAADGHFLPLLPLASAVRAAGHQVAFATSASTLPHASVVVSHGGSGSTLGALGHGCPIVFVPQGADQFENARATADAGAGIAVMPERQSVPNLREAVRTMLVDPSYAMRAELIAQEIAALPSAAQVADSLFSGDD